MASTFEIPDLSGVHHWTDLSTLMIDWAQELLYFDSFSILTIDQHRQSYQKVAGIASGTLFFHDLPYRGSLIEHNVNLIEAAGEPILFSFSQDVSRFADKNIITNLKNFGQRQAIVTTLKIGDLVIGIISLDSYKVNQYTKDNFPIFKSIAANIALAIKNISDFGKTDSVRSLPETK